MLKIRMLWTNQYVFFWQFPNKLLINLDVISQISIELFVSFLWMTGDGILYRNVLYHISEQLSCASYKQIYMIIRAHFKKVHQKSKISNLPVFHAFISNGYSFKFQTTLYKHTMNISQNSVSTRQTSKYLLDKYPSYVSSSSSALSLSWTMRQCGGGWAKNESCRQGWQTNRHTYRETDKWTYIDVSHTPPPPSLSSLSAFPLTICTLS